MMATSITSSPTRRGRSRTIYGTIRPKRRIRPGERPLHALRQRGVEYVEVRLMDLDPFLPVGIDTDHALPGRFPRHCAARQSARHAAGARHDRSQQAAAAPGSRGREPASCSRGARCRCRCSSGGRSRCWRSARRSLRSMPHARKSMAPEATRALTCALMPWLFPGCAIPR